jgi:hypothetical protein
MNSGEWGSAEFAGLRRGPIFLDPGHDTVGFQFRQRVIKLREQISVALAHREAR